VTDIVATYPGPGPEKLFELKRQVEAAGMRLTHLERKIPHLKFVHRLPGWEQQIEDFKQLIRDMAAAGRHLHEAFSAGAAGTPAAAYAGRVRSLPPRNIRGFLTGFIDLVVESGGTWYLLDWKTHRLGPHPADYAPEKLRAAIVEHDYVLQYHLYALALRAVLAGRVPDFDYAQHFGGIAYVFLRGVSAPEPHAGPGDPMPGVFVDRPELAVLDALDHALGRQP